MKAKLIFGFSMALILISIFIPVFAQDCEYIVKFHDDCKIPREVVDYLEPMLETKNIYKVSDIDILDGLEEYIEKKTPNAKYNLIKPESNSGIQLFSLDNLWQFDMVDASYAHGYEAYGNEVRVAVIDTGCYLHDDFKDNVIVTRSYINDIEDETDTDVTDNDGHGTHVAGIISRVAPEAKLVILKCMDKSGSVTLEQLIKPIFDAVYEYGCSVINISWIIEASDLNEEEISWIEEWIDFSAEYAVIVAAVGNGGTTNLAYPAAFDNVIGVGSIGSEKDISSFSRINDSVMVVAPGENVLSTYNDGEYASKSGTSQAAPLVSGLAAAALSVKEDLTPSELKEIIVNSCEDLGDDGYDRTYGYGLINGKNIIEPLIETAKTYTSPITDNTIMVLNNTNETLNGIGIWAEYDSDGNYIKSTNKTISLEPMDKVKETYSFNTNNSIKFFFWDSLDKMKPLAVSRQQSVYAN